MVSSSSQHLKCFNCRYGKATPPLIESSFFKNYIESIPYSPPPVAYESLEITKTKGRCRNTQKIQPVDNSKKYMINLFNFLKKFNKTHIVIFTKTNADTQGRIINNLIDQFTKKYSNVLSFKSLGQIKYLSTLKYCEFVIGNSSSGVIETPHFKKSTINIGTRQQGRIKPINIVDSNYDTKSLFLAFKKISSSKFKNKIKYMKNPFYKPDTAKKICLYLEKVNKKSSTIKFFNDL